MAIYPDEFIAEDGKTYVERDGRMLRVAANGALIDPVNGGFVKGGKLTTAITSSEMAKDYAQRRAEKRRQIVIEAANEAVERDDWDKRYGDYAFVAAITNTAMVKATTPEDPKAIEAARFVLSQAGLMTDDDDEKGGATSVLEQLGREAVLHILERAKAARESGQ